MPRIFNRQRIGDQQTHESPFTSRAQKSMRRVPCYSAGCFDRTGQCNIFCCSGTVELKRSCRCPTERVASLIRNIYDQSRLVESIAGRIRAI